MFKELCATLLLLCSSIISDFDFNYEKDDRYTFISGIVDCTVHFNAVLPPQHRVVVVISAAQAVIESNWGESRFAREANNFYGIIQTDPTEPHIKSLKNPKVILKKYESKCLSVADYVALLNRSSFFEPYREVRYKQVVTNQVQLNDIIDTLEPYAADPLYTKKLTSMTMQLMVDYPDIFGVDELLNQFNNLAKKDI
tara:strand:+ start:1976 stop:2566 length:591 start_codon:yes stop_codon:yes gene_type:complete